MILALDLGATIGAAWGNSFESACKFNRRDGVSLDAVRLPTGDRGMRFAAAENAVLKWVRDVHPDMIVKEAQLHPQAGGTSAAVQVFHAGLHAHVEQIGYRHGFVVGKTVLDVAADDVRRSILGRCRRTKKERENGVSMKDIVGKRLHQLGWSVLDHNAADALALLLYQSSLMARISVPDVSPCVGDSELA